MSNSFHPAKWWEHENSKIKCLLCPRNCLITNAQKGFCGTRKNIEGSLVSVAYGHPVAVHIDPIEKKPLNEFLPGTFSLSIGTYGCNLECAFCQNYHLSRGNYPDKISEKEIPPEEIASIAVSNKCASVSFTYNEPIIWAEYMLDIAVAAKRKKLATVMVSNGYITQDAAQDIFPLIDAANIDMKGFSENFYAEMTNARLRPVLDSIKYFYHLGKHLEITNLIIPGKNDSDEMINNFLEWVKKELNPDIPIHFSAYHPDYKFKESPATTPAILHKIKNNSIKAGLRHIYLGNI